MEEIRSPLYTKQRQETKYQLSCHRKHRSWWFLVEHKRVIHRASLGAFGPKLRDKVRSQRVLDLNLCPEGCFRASSRDARCCDCGQTQVRYRFVWTYGVTLVHQAFHVGRYSGKARRESSIPWQDRCTLQWRRWFPRGLCLDDQKTVRHELPVQNGQKFALRWGVHVRQLCRHKVPLCSCACIKRRRKSCRDRLSVCIRTCRIWVGRSRRAGRRWRYPLTYLSLFGLNQTHTICVGFALNFWRGLAVFELAGNSRY